MKITDWAQSAQKRKAPSQSPPRSGYADLHWSQERQRRQQALKGKSFAAQGDGITQVSSSTVAPSFATLASTNAKPSKPIICQPAVIDLEPLIMATKLLHILTSATTSPAPLLSKELDALREEYIALANDDQDPLELLASNIIAHWVPHTWDFVTSCMQDNRLSKYEKGDTRPGLYLDVLKVVSLRGAAEHYKVYGGYTAQKNGFYGRISWCHESESYRASSPSLHYTIYDLPGTESIFYLWAVYKQKDPVPEMVFGEGVMIGLLGLYENEGYYNQLKGINVPICMNGVHNPLQGLNGDSGLRYDSGKVKLGDLKTHQKLVAYISTGVEVKIQHGSKTRINLVQDKKITIYKYYLDRYRQLGKSDWVTVFVDLSPQVQHKFPFYNYTGNSELKRFGLWLAFTSGNGFWLQYAWSIQQKEEAKVKAKECASFLLQCYGLLKGE